MEWLEWGRQMWPRYWARSWMESLYAPIRCSCIADLTFCRISRQFSNVKTISCSASSTLSTPSMRTRSLGQVVRPSKRCWRARSYRLWKAVPSFTSSTSSLAWWTHTMTTTCIWRQRRLRSKSSRQMETTGTKLTRGLSKWRGSWALMILKSTLTTSSGCQSSLQMFSTCTRPNSLKLTLEKHS